MGLVILPVIKMLWKCKYLVVRDRVLLKDRRGNETHLVSKVRGTVLRQVRKQAGSESLEPETRSKVKLTSVRS